MSARMAINLTLRTSARGRFVGQTRQRHKGDVVERYCVTGKRCHPSHESAFAEAERMMSVGHVSPGCHQTPARCTDCGRWHVYNRVIIFRNEVSE
jgi:hypothetical protein